MKNEENKFQKDDIINPEQFQVGRAQAEDQEEQTNEAGYTAEEDQFADGKGTQLAEEFEITDAELEAELPKNQEKTEDDIA
jgi:hypothetical protein